MSSIAPQKRAAFIDGLRGIAAMSVVAFHIYKKTLYAPLSAPELPGPLHWFLRHGDLGVSVFFVISGYVIASSITGARITPRFLGRFALRRSVRLDPPYWAAIALEILLIAVSRRMFHEPAALPSLAKVVAHLGYAQSILGYGHLIAVFWTLCIEVQLYLCFVALVGVAQRLGRRGRALVFVPVFGISLAFPYVFDVFAQNTYLVRYWYLFFGGVLVFWTLEKRVSEIWLVTFTVVVAAVQLTRMWSPSALAMLCTTWVLWFAGRRDRLTVWLSSPLMQWLGRISYSLYLVHLPISGRALNLVTRRTHTPIETGGQLMLLALGIIASLVAAQLLYWLVERPTVALSKRIRKSPQGKLTASDPLCNEVGTP